MKIIDNISKEIIFINKKDKAIKTAKERVKFHNTEFCYKRGKHYSANCNYYINGEEIVIK